MLFIRGNAISGAPYIRGTSQLPISYWYNYEEGYNKGMGGNYNIVNLIVADKCAWLT